MTAKETERLARVEERVKSVKQDVKDLKESTEKGFEAMNVKLDGAIARMDNMNKSFITAAQAKTVAWLLGFLVTVATLGVLIYNALHGNK